MSRKYCISKKIMLYSSVLLGISLVSIGGPAFADEHPSLSAEFKKELDNEKSVINLANAHVSEVSKYLGEDEKTSIVPKSVEIDDELPKADVTNAITNTDVSYTKATEYDELINDWNSIIAGNDIYDATNSYMANFNIKLEESVDKHIATLNMDNDRKYLWEDKSDYAVSSNMTATYRKLEDIAKQISNSSSKYFKNPEAIKLVKDSLEFLYQNVYNENTRYQQQKGNASVNWWDFEIGTPRAINNTLSLMKPYFTQDEILKYTQPIEVLVPDPTSFRKTSINPDFPTFKAAVANMTDMGRVKLISGILRQDDASIKETIQAIETAFGFVTEGNGFYKDGSLIDHAVTNKNSPLYNKGVAYNGSYGSVLIDGLSQLIPLIQKTKSPMSSEKINVIHHWINESFLPIIIHGELMDMTRGRSISRVSTESHVAAVEILRGILRIAEMSEEPYKTTLKSKVKTFVTEGNSYYNVFDNLKTYRDIKLMKDLLEDEGIPIIKSSNYVKVYDNMDKLVVYNANKGYGFGLSMFSDKTQNFEAMNNENLRGWHTSDGMFYLYNGDLGHYSDNYWATVNPYDLPGTTEVDVERLDGTATNIKNSPELVGMGVLPQGSFVKSFRVDDTTALAAMAFTNFNKTLSLNKGWFILDGKIVFVGNSITAKSEDKVYTTIDQRKEAVNKEYLAYVDNQLINLADGVRRLGAINNIFLESSDTNRNIGYIFLKPSDIQISKKSHIGKWSDIRGNEKSPIGTSEVTNTFITIKQEHQVDGDTYAYVLVPNITREEFNRLVSNMELSLLKNSKDVVSLYDASSHRQFSIKFNEKTFDVVTVSSDKEKGLVAIDLFKDKDLRGIDLSYKDDLGHISQTLSSIQYNIDDNYVAPKPMVNDALDNPTKETLDSEVLPKTGEVNIGLSLYGFLAFALAGLLKKRAR